MTFLSVKAAPIRKSANGTQSLTCPRHSVPIDRQENPPVARQVCSNDLSCVEAQTL